MKAIMALLTFAPLVSLAGVYESNFPGTGNLVWNESSMWSPTDPATGFPAGKLDDVYINYNSGANRTFQLPVDVDIRSLDYNSTTNFYLQLAPRNLLRNFKVGTLTRTSGNLQFVPYYEHILHVTIGDLIIEAGAGNLDIGGGSPLGSFEVTGATSIKGTTAYLQNSTGATVKLGKLDIASTSYVNTSARNLNGTVAADSLSGAGSVWVQSPSGGGTATRGDFVIEGTSVSSGTFTGVLRDGNAAGKLHFTMKGSGEQELRGVNTYSGITRIEGGRLIIAGAGSINATEKIVIENGELRTLSSTNLTSPIEFISGTISGSGGITASLTIGEGMILAPGNGLGSQTFTGNQTWQEGGMLKTELSRGTPGSSDLLSIVGSLDL